MRSGPAMRNEGGSRINMRVPVSLSLLLLSFSPLSRSRKKPDPPLPRDKIAQGRRRRGRGGGRNSGVQKRSISNEREAERTKACATCRRYRGHTCSPPLSRDPAVRFFHAEVPRALHKSAAAATRVTMRNRG